MPMALPTTVQLCPSFTRLRTSSSISPSSSRCCVTRVRRWWPTAVDWSRSGVRCQPEGVSTGRAVTIIGRRARGRTMLSPAGRTEAWIMTRARSARRAALPRLFRPTVPRIDRRSLRESMCRGNARGGGSGETPLQPQAAERTLTTTVVTRDARRVTRWGCDLGRTTYLCREPGEGACHVVERRALV